MKLAYKILFFILLIPALATAAMPPEKASSQNKSALYVTDIEAYDLMKNKDKAANQKMAVIKVHE
jgi:hypothetical protein